MLFFRCLILFCITLSSFDALCGTRALWVTRWDFKTPEDIHLIMDNAKSIGTDKVLFQIRGNATVYYPSKIEPWAWGLASDGFDSLGVDPGWDPLKTAIDAAHERGMELHAWLNIFPGWRGMNPVPPHVNQVWRTKRHWFMIDHNGTLMRPSKSWYTFLSPGIRDVQLYLGSIFAELSRNYPQLDGLHMDYIRYPAHKELGYFRDFSYDKETKANYRKQYGKFPQHDSKDWMKFKSRNIANSIKTMRDAAKKENPQIEVSATCVAEINKATMQTAQDIGIWLEEDLLDWITPMAYKRTTKEYQEVLLDLMANVDSKYKSKLVPGINAAFPNFPVNTLQAQIMYNQNHGFGGSALFAYKALFPNGKPNRLADTVQKLWIEDRLQEVLTN